VNGKLLLLA